MRHIVVLFDLGKWVVKDADCPAIPVSNVTLRTIFHRKKQPSAGDMPYNMPSAFEEWKPSSAFKVWPFRGPVEATAFATFSSRRSCVH